MRKGMKNKLAVVLAGITAISTVTMINSTSKYAFADTEYSENISKSACEVNNDFKEQVDFSINAFKNIDAAYKNMFGRIDHSDNPSSTMYSYDEIDTKKYPREKLLIPSGKNKLAGFLYGAENTKGLIVISLGMHGSDESKLIEMEYFVDHGWKVLIYDYTGTYASEGENMGGYYQMPRDLDAVLTYVEKDRRFRNVPIMLFGHSLGGYTTGASLQYGHNVKAAVVGSAFDTPRQVWVDSTTMYSGEIGERLAPYADLYITLASQGMADFSAVDGINSVDCPVLVLSGSAEEVYSSHVSEVYAKRNKITNLNCEFKLIDTEKHNTHNGYWYTDAAVDYQEKVDKNEIEGTVDKALYNEHDLEMMDYINDFYLRALKK